MELKFHGTQNSKGNFYLAIRGGIFVAVMLCLPPTPSFLDVFLLLATLFCSLHTSSSHSHSHHYTNDFLVDLLGAR